MGDDSESNPEIQQNQAESIDDTIKSIDSEDSEQESKTQSETSANENEVKEDQDIIEPANKNNDQNFDYYDYGISTEQDAPTSSPDHEDFEIESVTSAATLHEKEQEHEKAEEKDH